MNPLARLFPAVLGLLLLVPGCTTLEQFAALTRVDFTLDRVSNGLLAGVPIERVRDYGELRPSDVVRLTAAAARGEVPLRFTLHVAAENPAANPTAARLVSLDWRLFLNDTETVAGTFNDERLIQPGTTADLPISIELDLVRFFGRNARDLIDVALAVAGEEASPTQIRLAARPTITTEFGPIRYPGEITIVSRTVGQR
ncbi:MAG TPA: hypothetical protein VD962_06960 [Rubricoccaceae bacterium]|nr:hypothetical protein [Rubricoccaceae bacterium]